MKLTWIEFWEYTEASEQKWTFVAIGELQEPTVVERERRSGEWKR